jgi:LmbE family N-acetylglucosaminyl deacetylase
MKMMRYRLFAMKKRIIVFSPHWDDGTLGCGGTIAKKINEGFEVLIVVMISTRHAKEAQRAPRILDLPKKNLIFLNFKDRTLENNEREAQEKIIEILRKTSPAEVYFTYEKDDHPDHRATNRIVRNAIKKLDLSTMKYQYSIWQTYGRIGPILDSFLNLFKHNIICIDISKFIHLKEAVLKETKCGPLLIKRHLKTREVFYKDE